jgi:hypothetical protein
MITTIGQGIPAAVGGVLDPARVPDLAGVLDLGSVPNLAGVLDLAGRLCHGGEETVFCHRCTGVWAGAALALPVVVLARRRVSPWFWILLAAAFIQMPVLGYGRIPLPDAVKTLSGQAFALSAVFGLAFGPARRLPGVRLDRNAGLPFLVTSAAGIISLQVLIRIDLPAAKRACDILSFIGLAAAAILVIVFAAAALMPRRAGPDWHDS